jgi:PAS domain S-box-containing protein
MGGLFSGKSADVEHERLAAVILDGMYQFVALLTPEGDILEVNRAALEAAGQEIEEIRGKPFWTARWWEISKKTQEELQAAIRRAAAGEFVRYEVEVYGEGLKPITIDFSLQPIWGESGEIEYLLPEGRNITERKQAEDEVARQTKELRVLNERLKELDRLKTQFFANVSHEFRTPLTLMLGPLENALTAIDADKYPDIGADLATSHRNALRLLKLVNTMLDFSRIEAGRVQASYRPTDIAAFTAELASNFRSACEKAGLRLIVDCAPFNGGEQAYLDRDMWEKIVLNLVSNAFKFTLEGEIEVRVATVDGHARLTVRDTGVGIPSEELPRMFERFHRIDHTRGRTHEGTGIGLALVLELVKLHGGMVTVDSAIGAGSIFTVSIPLGKAHLDAERIGSAADLASTGVAPVAYIEEAVRWLPDEPTILTDQNQIIAGDDSARAAQGAHEEESAGAKPRVLWADDNADMRTYVGRLLAGRYDVQAVSDGEAALEAARAYPPNLVLSDVMMPKLDGFGLLRALRDDPKLQEIPVILLSARAGEESRVEGLEAGADDYLVKPFTARELMARVETHLRMANLRREAADREARLRSDAELERLRLQELLTQAPAAIGLTRCANHGWVYVNDLFIRTTGRTSVADFVGKTVGESMPELEGQGFLELLDEVYRTGKPYCGHEMKVMLNRSDPGKLEEGYWDFVYQPVHDAGGQIEGILIHAVDVTDKMIARRAIEESEERFRTIVQTTPECVKVVAADGVLLHMNSAGLAMVGAKSAATVVGKNVYNLIAPEDRERFKEFNERICRGEKDSLEFDIVALDGVRHHMETHGAPLRNPDGEIVQLAITHDVTAKKQAQEKLHMSLEKLSEQAHLLDLSNDAILVRDQEDRVTYWNRGATEIYGYTREESAGRVTHELLRTEFPEPLERIQETLRRDGRWSGELIHTRKDGAKIIVGSCWVLERDANGKTARILETNDEITQRKAAEDARRRLAAIVESSEDAIVSKDLNGIVRSWNSQAARMFGYTAEEMIGQPITIIIPPELYSDEEMILGKIQNGQKIDHFETVRIAKSGERIDVSLSISPVKDEQGRIVGAAKIARDIREHKRIEGALRTSEKLAAAGRLAATVAHEINNPLEAVTNLVYLANRDLPNADKVAAHLLSARQELDRVAHITRQTLGFYRDTTSPIRMNCASTIDDLLLLYEKRLEVRNIRIVKQFDRDAEVTAFAGEIRQAISNLLTNSMDAMPAGGSLTIRVRKTHDWSNSGAPGVRITIADTGGGIAPKHRQNLFQPFFTTKSDVGTGLGLWITRGIVDKHGGLMHLKSRTAIGASGTAFSILIPCNGKQGIERRSLPGAWRGTVPTETVAR